MTQQSSVGCSGRVIGSVEERPKVRQSNSILFMFHAIDSPDRSRWRFDRVYSCVLVSVRCSLVCRECVEVTSSFDPRARELDDLDLSLWHPNWRQIDYLTTDCSWRHCEMLNEGSSANSFDWFYHSTINPR
jgi:hypothetical protein